MNKFRKGDKVRVTNPTTNYEKYENRLGLVTTAKTTSESYNHVAFRDGDSAAFNDHELTLIKRVEKVVKTSKKITIKIDDKHYAVKVKCSNCGFKGKVTFQKGRRVRTSDCPNCAVRFIETLSLI